MSKQLSKFKLFKRSCLILYKISFNAFSLTRHHNRDIVFRLIFYSTMHFTKHKLSLFATLTKNFRVECYFQAKKFFFHFKFLKTKKI